jgi:hypothetical protein
LTDRTATDKLQYAGMNMTSKSSMNAIWFWQEHVIKGQASQVVTAPTSTGLLSATTFAGLIVAQIRLPTLLLLLPSAFI